MPPWSNTEPRYGAIAFALYWGMAVLVLFLTAVGFYMARLPDPGSDTARSTLILVHKALGMLAFAAALLRLAWRLLTVPPRFSPEPPDWEEVSARFVHLMFHVLLLAVPLSGWMMASAGGQRVSFFGLFDVPHLIGPNEWLFLTLVDLHRWLAYLLLGFLLLHVGASVRHHLRLRKDALRRRLP